MPANPFDFEDPERFEAVEFPVEPDIEYVLGVRLERQGLLAWRCPHDRKWALSSEQAALACLRECEVDEYDADDPKHPTYHDRYAERADLDRKRAKGE